MATLPVPLGNREAYFISNSSHGIRSAVLIQRFSGFILRPIGWLKSRNDGCQLVYTFFNLFTCKISQKSAQKMFLLFYSHPYSQLLFPSPYIDQFCPAVFLMRLTLHMQKAKSATSIKQTIANRITIPTFHFPLLSSNHWL